MDRKLNGLLANPGIPWFAAALMLVICLPALRAGFVGDDYYHRAILLGEGETETLYKPLLELFRFVPAGDGADHLREVGVIPWWTHPDLELGFLRPHIRDTTLQRRTLMRSGDSEFNVSKGPLRAGAGLRGFWKMSSGANFT